MKALTLWQPYATLVADGHKTIETRSWAPPPSLVGERIAIHAGINCIPSKDLPDELAAALCREYGRAWDSHLAGLPRMAVVATARLADAWQVDHLSYWVDGETPRVRANSGRAEWTWVEVDTFGDFSAGRWLWILDGIQKVCPPLRIRGRQRLWNLDEELLP